MGRLHAELTLDVHQRAELDFGWIVVFPVDRCGPEDKVEQGTIEDLFDFAPLPSLRSQARFLHLGSHRRRGVSCECPRGLGKANERLLEHGEQKGQTPSEIRSQSFCLSPKSQSKLGPFDSCRWIAQASTTQKTTLSSLATHLSTLLDVSPVLTTRPGLSSVIRTS